MALFGLVDGPETHRSPEYIKYQKAHDLQNLGVESNITSAEHLAELQSLGVVGSDYKAKYALNIAGGDSDRDNSSLLSWSRANRYWDKRQIVEGEYTGTEKLDERGYYEDKYKREQDAFQEKVDLQQKGQKEAFDKEMENQKTILAQQAEANATALEERRAAIELEDNTKLRDDMMAERSTAATSAVDYVNQKVNRERSNAALFGVNYSITDEQKSGRVSDYFSSIWNSEYEDKLTGLFDKIGKPEGFEDFTVKLGEESAPDTIAAPDSPTGVETRKDNIVGRTRGVKNTLLTAEEKLGGSTTVLGG